MFQTFIGGFFIHDNALAGVAFRIFRNQRTLERFLQFIKVDGNNTFIKEAGNNTIIFKHDEGVTR